MPPRTGLPQNVPDYVGSHVGRRIGMHLDLLGTLDSMAIRTAPPFTVTLMQPTLIAQPFHHKGWVYEEKVDGYRMVACKGDDAVTIMSRQGKDYASRFPDLAKALASLPARSFILDGEVAVYDRAHISRFEWLRARPKDGRATLPVYMVFDVLELDGKDWRPEPLWKRRRVLEELVAPERMILPVRRLSSNGLKAWAQAVHKGYEGIVAKDPQSPYVAGRTLQWLKVKQAKYREGEGAGSRRITSRRITKVAVSAGSVGQGSAKAARLCRDPETLSNTLDAESFAECALR
jgi:bifunctional non-homologous end joining protein LigD